MKIIGKAGDETYLAEISLREIANIMGEYSFNYQSELIKKLGLNPDYEKSVVGREINVADFYAASKLTAREWNKEYNFKEAIRHIDALKADLNKMADTYIRKLKTPTTDGVK